MSRRTGGTSDLAHSYTSVTIRSRRKERSRSQQQQRSQSGTATPSRPKSYDSTTKNRSSSSQGRRADRRGEITQRGKGGVASKLDDCECGLNVYGALLGPTVDEQILASLLALLEIFHECPDEKWDTESSRRSGISESEESSSYLTVTHSASKAAPAASRKWESTRSSSTISPAAKSQSCRFQSVRSSSADSESIRSLSGRLELMRSLSTRLLCMRSPSARFPSLPSDRRSVPEHISEGGEEDEERPEELERESLLIQRFDEGEETTIRAEIKNVSLPPREEAVAMGVEHKIKSLFSASENSRLAADDRAVQEHYQREHASSIQPFYSEKQDSPEEKDEDLQLQHVHQPSEFSVPHSAFPANRSPENSPPSVERHQESNRHHMDSHPHQLEASIHELSNRSEGRKGNLKNHDFKTCCSRCRCRPSSNLYESKMDGSLKSGKNFKGSTKANSQEQPHHEESSSTTSCPYLRKATFKPSKKNLRKKSFTCNGAKSKARMVSDSVSISACEASTTITIGEEVAGIGDLGHAGDAMCNVRYAITRITKFPSYTTFEVMKSTKKKPKVMPTMLEGVFVLRNKKWQ